MRGWRGRQRDAGVAPASAPRPRAIDPEHSHYNRQQAYARVAAATGLDVAVVRDLWLAETSKSSTRRSKLPPYDLTAAHIRALDMLRMTEDQLAAQIVRWIKVSNSVHPQVEGQPRFLHYHTYNSQRSPSGWPDMTLLDRALGLLYVWEEKREDGEPTEIQGHWLDGLARVFDPRRWDQGHIDTNGTFQVVAPNPQPSVARVLGIIRPSNAEATLKRILDL